MIDSRRLVWIDETALRTDMTRLRGRAPAGQRLVEAVPNARWKTCTLVGALGTAGMRCSMVLEGAIDRVGFELFVEKFLVPMLVPGQIVVMDNLSSHKGKRVRQLIRAAGCRCVYLPPYSWDLNPIEQAFSKLKTGVRAAAARTVKALTAAAGRLAATLTPSDCLGYLVNCGYNAKPDTGTL